MISRRLARLLGCTQGQASTLLIGLALAVVLSAAGIPPTLRDRPVERAQLAVPRLRNTPPEPVPLTDVTDVLAPLPETGLPAFAPTPLESTLPFDFTSPAPPPEPDPGPPLFGTITKFATVGQPGVPGGIAVDGAGRVYVTTNNGTARGSTGPSLIYVYGPDGVVAESYAVDGQPERHADGLTGIALGPDSDGAGIVFVADAATARVLRVDMARRTQQTYAALPNLPACVLIAVATNCEPSVEDHVAYPSSLAFDDRGRLYVADGGQATLWRVPVGGGQPVIVHQSLDYSGGRVLQGLALDDDGNPVFAVTESFASTSPGSGVVYRIRMNGDNAGERLELFRSASGEHPAGVAVGTAGRVYVSLRGVGQVLILGDDGRERSRFRTAESDPAAFRAPASLAFLRTTLLVANEDSDRDDADRWSIVDVAVDDTGLRPRRGA